MSASAVMVAGAGKRARDIGVFLLASGHDVIWVDRQRAWLDDLGRRVARDLRRAAEPTGGVAPRLGTPAFGLVGDAALPDVDVLLETIEEDPSAKREIVAALRGHVRPGGLVATNASSILPREVGPGVVGLHFFFPVALTGFVEAIFEGDAAAAARGRCSELAASLGLAVIAQDPASAFAVNRLLLPIQSECLRELRAGAAPVDLQAASVSELLPWGVLGPMDSVGLDTVAAAAARYVARMQPAEAADHAALRDGLAQLVAMGKRGAKNRDGLLRGRPLPWTVAGAPLRAGFGDELAILFRHTCERMLAAGQLDAPSLTIALSGLFDAAYPWAAAAELGGRERREAVLAARHRETGLGYWELRSP